MRINKIVLKNFRGYGNSEVVFTKNDKKNVSIIAGKNGFGKTTFLTSLIWVMYGSLMRQVEDKYKRDIQNLGGYENYLKDSVNHSVVNKFESGEIKDAKMSVELELADVLIPSIPCKKVIIKRSFSYKTNKESLSILIDDQEHELTKEVGYDIFINDFILPREIAKFFFFDAEKIVSLAEAKTKNELRSLSRAYSEVLGIKKYEDLKYNLNTLLTKLKREGVTGVNKEKLDKLVEKDDELRKLIELNESKQQEIEQGVENNQVKIDNIQEKLIREGNEITIKKYEDLKYNLNTLLTKLKREGVTGVNKEKLDKLVEKDDELRKLIELNESKQQEIEQGVENNQVKIDNIQEKLIREGNEITIEELLALKSKRSELQNDLVEARSHLRDVMDIVPLAIAEKQFSLLVEQLKKEISAKKISANSEFVLEEIKTFSNSIKEKLAKLPSFKGNEKEIEEAVAELESERLAGVSKSNTKILLNYSEEETQDIIATYNYVTTSFKQQFEMITKSERDIRQHIGRLNRKIKQSESKKGNPIAQQLRADKEELKEAIDKAQEKKEKLLQELGKLKAEFNSNAKVLSEYEKKFNLIEIDQKKYVTTQKLLDQINKLTIRIKEEKKYALEKSILLGLQKLMHKKDFISRVNIRIENDIMDIELIKPDGKVRDKDSMSKGEQ